jgi:hypothetical protein
MIWATLAARSFFCVRRLVVTLGNAALRVLGAIVEVEDVPSRLRVEGYGVEVGIRVDGRRVRWMPLAHPAAPAVYRGAHERWVRTGDWSR